MGRTHEQREERKAVEAKRRKVRVQWLKRERVGGRNEELRREGREGKGE